MVQPQPGQIHQRNMNVDGDSAAADAAFLAAVVGGDRPEDKFTDKKQTTYKKYFLTFPACF